MLHKTQLGAAYAEVQESTHNVGATARARLSVSSLSHHEQVWITRYDKRWRVSEPLAKE